MSIKLETAEIDCECIKRGSFPFLTEGECIDLGFLAPISAADKDIFFPKAIYVRKEMCEVFKELIKSNRKQRQILIGSPGVGKSLLLFLVALHRVLTDGIPTCFVRKPKDPFELTSVFLMKKVNDEEKKIAIHYSRKVKPKEKVTDMLERALQEHGGIEPDDALTAVLADKVLLYIDGLHEGDTDLSIPHHYLSTSGGYDTPQGESARHATLVVLAGWQKVALGKALESTSDILTRTSKTVGAAKSDNMEGLDEADSDAADLDATFREETLEDIFYHTGGRIREAFEYAKDPEFWKAEKKSMIDRIPREAASLSIVDTKGSGDPKSPDRVRTMFRNEEGAYFGSALQIVDSQYFARLLQDRVGLEDYYNAYVDAKNRGLASAAGCHFEELLHQLFHKRPKPIQSVLQSTGNGAEGVAQFSTFLCYWIPSVPNFANIDAAVVIQNSDGSVTVWCLQYTVSKKHMFNSRTFLIKFLRPLLQNFDLKDVSVSVKIIFIVPEDVYGSFTRPDDVADAGYEGFTDFADCSSVEAVEGLFEKLDFIDKPVTFFDAPPTAQRARLS